MDKTSKARPDKGVDTSLEGYGRAVITNRTGFFMGLSQLPYLTTKKDVVVCHMVACHGDSHLIPFFELRVLASVVGWLAIFS